MKKLFTICILIAGLISLYSCKKDEDNKNTEEYLGTVDFKFSQTFKGIPLEFDKLIYQNEAGNKFMVNEIQYFLSEFKLINENGIEENIIPQFHYIDTDIPTTHSLSYALPQGKYNAIQFTFGISEKENKSNRFPNPPESDMFWPFSLGGGYHYMKLNGKFINPENETLPFNFHLGPAKINENQMEHYSFVVNIPLKSCDITHEDESLRNIFTINMEIDNWFKNPNTWDINVFGSKIMENPKAMKAACENGSEDVFTVEFKKETIELDEN